MVELLNGDVTSGLSRHLAAEIKKPPIFKNEESYITCERYAIDLKLVLNTNRKPWPIFRLVTSLLTSLNS
jgi:hypothetical protein